MVGKVRTKASEESYCSGQLPETQPDPIFRNSRDAYGRVSKQEYTEITILMGKMMMKHGILSVPYLGMFAVNLCESWRLGTISTEGGEVVVKAWA